ncbi:protein of unknown function [Methylorubrum extorquens DM4]|uniref:Uncharacterized protein n=1 Tax=Methylorubrum extorquens (strain DSM 6343 / CIP 106787 / DM4) TaxID=661410 RepID=C7CCI2_METED|nr:protein of unknown function [Methylorubrum extorquens DM4]
MIVALPPAQQQSHGPDHDPRASRLQQARNTLQVYCECWLSQRQGVRHNRDTAPT